MPQSSLLGGMLAIIVAAVAADCLAGGDRVLDGVLLAILIATAVATRAMPDGGFYLLAAGELLVVAVARSHPLPGAVIQVVLFAMVLSSTEISLRREGREFAVFALIIVAVVALVSTVHHAWIPIGIAAAIAAVTALFVAASDHQLREFYGDTR